MQIKQKIRKVYEKYGVSVSDEALKTILKDKERTKGIMRLYKEEELESMNYILGKPEDNKYFTQQELEMMNKIDLFNRKTVEVCKKIWENETKVGALRCI